MSAIDLTAAAATATNSSDTESKAPKGESNNPGRWLARALGVVLIAFFIVVFGLPILWLILAPSKGATELASAGPLAFGSFTTLADNFAQLSAFQNGIVWQWMGNAVLYTGVALILTLLVSIPAGYALAMTEFAGRKLLLVLTLVVMLIPNTALVLPIFLEISAFKLVGTPWAVILPFSFFPFGVYLTFIYFSTSVSKDLLDAARMDGAGELRVFLRIALPLATPVVALVGFFNLVGNWNNYFLPFVMEPGRKAPIQVGLAELLVNVPLFNPTSSASVTLDLPVVALATLLSVAPILIVFLFSQRFLVEGMTAGGTKE